MRNLLLRRVNLPAGLRSQGSKAIYQRPSSLRLAGVRSLIGHACPPVGCLRSDSASPIKNGWPMPCWAAGPGRFSRLLMPPSSDLHAAMPTVWKSFAGSADTLNHGIKFLVGGPSPHGQRLYSGSKRKDREQDPKAVAYWYLASCALVFSTVVIGGLTRLTESGLSIVEWSVIKGMKAPSSAEEWEREFEKYKLYPEYQV